jgi:hypothetical protein|tara:strand:+ start:464 stop:1171 length:708 start_codon:yes stop_codon:yes gene_type:complete
VTKEQTIDWLGRIAIFTFIYYVATFAFEIGFFWDLGLEFIPVFSVFEHAMNAVVYATSTVGVLIFVYLAFQMPAIFFVASNDQKKIENSDTVSLTRKQRIISIALMAPAGMICVAALIGSSLDAIKLGFSPKSVWPILASFTFFAYLVDHQLGRKRIWALPALLLFILSPVALGEKIFHDRIESSSSIYELREAEAVRVVDVHFIGNAKVLFTNQNGTTEIRNFSDDLAIRKFTP